jgi:uncharacterized lipoprotein YajG
MKKLFLSSIYFVLATLFFLSSCKKEDTTQSTITNQDAIEAKYLLLALKMVF